MGDPTYGYLQYFLMSYFTTPEFSSLFITSILRLESQQGVKKRLQLPLSCHVQKRTEAASNFLKVSISRLHHISQLGSRQETWVPTYYLMNFK